MAESEASKKSCNVCGKSNPKYQCPGCERKSCSLACVKCHKKQFLCSGARCKTKFISVGNFTDRDFLSDYRFLEDVDRLAFTASHDSQRSWKRWGPEAFLLRRKAKESGVKLKLMPVGMSKRKENSSKFDKASKCVMWRVRWLFPQAGMEYVDNRYSKEKEI